MRVRISVGDDLRFVARFERDRAPRSCEAFAAVLPFRRHLLQARWSGESAWIPLGDCPRMQGSLAVLPRSNHAVPPPGSRWRRFDFSAGDVLFVNSLTLHRALPNRSAEIRVSVDFRFCRA